MTCVAWRPGLMVALFCLVIAVPAGAQSSVDRWAGLKVGGLQTVYVKDASGAESKGQLLRLDSDALVLLSGHAERRFDRHDVVRIQKHDSLRNGTLIGFAAGTIMGLVAGGISDCPGDDPGGSCAAFRAATVALSAGVYSGLGAGVDALIRGRSTIYERREGRSSIKSSPGPTLTLARFVW